MTEHRIPVIVNDDLVRWYTRAEIDSLWAGVDREACDGITAELDLDNHHEGYADKPKRVQNP